MDNLRCLCNNCDVMWYCSYPANMKCQVTYKPESGCKKMRFSCTDVDFPNRDRKCKRGDYLAIGNKKYDQNVNFSHCKEFKLMSFYVSQYFLWKIYYFRYCRSSTIRKDANNKNIKVIFKSDRKTSGTGAQCNIKCIDPRPTTTTTSTTSTTTTTTTTISFTGWVYLKLCNYKWISQKWKYYIIALSSCPVKDTSCIATDGNNIVNSTTASESELDCASMYQHQ